MQGKRCFCAANGRRVGFLAICISDRGCLLSPLLSIFLPRDMSAKSTAPSGPPQSAHKTLHLCGLGSHSSTVTAPSPSLFYTGFLLAELDVPRSL